MKKFYNEVGGFLSAYPTKTTVTFDLTRELEVIDRMRPIDEARVKELMRSYEGRRVHGNPDPRLGQRSQARADAASD